MKYQSWSCIYLADSTVSLRDVLQYFVSPNLPKKQSNSDVIAVSSDWSRVSALSRLPVWNQTWLQMRFSINCPWFWVVVTISNSWVKSLHVETGPQSALKGAKTTGSWHFHSHIAMGHCHPLDITNHIKWFTLCKGKKAQQQCLQTLL